jgi:Lon protease-like protein
MFELPLFPLHTVLFPGVPLDLHIFEPRYKQMVRSCLDGSRQFGVVLIQQGDEAFGPLARPHLIGCTARILKVHPLSDGNLDLNTLGDERFRILSLDTNLPYLTGQVEALPLEVPHSLEVQKGVKRLKDMALKYLKLLSQLNNHEVDLSALQLPDEPLLLLFLSAALLQIPPPEKQPLLAAETSADLLTHLLRLYRRENAILATNSAGITNSPDANGDNQGHPWLN